MADGKSQSEVSGLQEIMIKKARKDFPNIPEWIDTRDTVAGNTIMFINTLTGEETEVGLCNLRGFLQGISFMTKF